jgi:hypothetical protein
MEVDAHVYALFAPGSLDIYLVLLHRLLRDNFVLLQCIDKN